MPRLHHAAAQWLHAQGQWLPAIRQAVLAGQWGLVGHYLVDDLTFARLFVGPQRVALHSLLADLATASSETPGAEVALGRAALALADLDLARADRELATARARLYDEAPEGAGTAGLALSVLTAIRAGLGADPDVALDQVLSAERALQLAPGEYPSGAPEVAVAIGSAKGRVLLRRGELTAAHDTLEEATRVAETARLIDATHELQGLTALVEAMSGHLRRATDLAVRLGVPEVVPGRRTARAEGTARGGKAAAAHTPAATLALAWVRTDECDAATAQWLVGSVETARALRGHRAADVGRRPAACPTRRGERRVRARRGRAPRGVRRTARPPGTTGGTGAWWPPRPGACWARGVRTRSSPCWPTTRAAATSRSTSSSGGRGSPPVRRRPTRLTR